MNQFKIKDNSIRKKEDFFEISKLASTVADKTLGQLEKSGVFVFPDAVKDSDDIEENQMVLQSVNDTYCSGNVMGFIGLGDERLVIESRFSRGNNDYLFQYLLEKVMGFPNVVNLETNAAHNDKMFFLLILLFPNLLKTAMRKGVFKTYVRVNYNDENVKGTIDIDRHISKNIPFIGNIAYNQREFEYDNYLTQLIRHTIEFIKKKPHGNMLLSKVKDEVKLIINATTSYNPKDLRKVIADNKKCAVKHAYFHEYRSLQKLCILILQNEKHQVGIGHQKLFGILFDGAWLWEEYINSLIKGIFYHPMNKSGKGAQWLFAKKTGEIYPDFISINAEKRIIADAKYKPIGNIRNRDYLQVLAYMYRFDAEKGYYLYPDANDEQSFTLHLNSGSSFEQNVSARENICVIKHGLVIPQDAIDYGDFTSKINTNELVFINRFIE